jgi:hypothetical protein
MRTDMLISVEFLAGIDISVAAHQAVKQAERLQIGIKFKFNEVNCTVWPGDSAVELVRQYQRAIRPRLNMAFGH